MEGCDAGGIYSRGKRIYPEGKHRNFLFFTQFYFANFEFIFAIKDPIFARRELDTP